ncbi:C40 family peptidase [Paracidovorax wautersii]|nr:C40 family peptidase [Paracidovorax wautersii]
MSRWICFLLLVGAQAVHAAPAASKISDDEIDRILKERGLMTQLQEVRNDVTDRTTTLVSTAMGFLGVPYRRGGSSAETGFDCSGFVRTIFEQAKGLVLPRRAKEQAAATEVIDKKDLKPGDLVFFNTMRHAFSHVGIYLGDGKFIHSPRSGSEVRVEDMTGKYWQRRFNGARRVLAEDDAAADAIANSARR